MRWLRMVLDLLFPARCAGCSALGTRWCPPCAATMAGLFEVRRTALRGLRAFAVTAYAGPARRLVLAYKERGRRELATPFGLALAEAVPKALARTLDHTRASPRTGPCWLVPAPSRWTAARARGGNHVELAARHAARELRARGVPAEVAPVLRLRGRVRDNVGLSWASRKANLHGHIRLHGHPPPPTDPTLLIDDVITTGATAAACTTTLHNAGVPVTAVLALTATV